VFSIREEVVANLTVVFKPESLWLMAEESFNHKHKEITPTQFQCSRTSISDVYNMLQHIFKSPRNNTLILTVIASLLINSSMNLKNN
jgi:hypothetical protein